MFNYLMNRGKRTSHMFLLTYDLYANDILILT